jgi:hypothetical protein
MRTIKLVMLFFLLATFLPTFLFTNVFAQEIQNLLRIADSTKVQVITTVDKSKNVGRIIKVGEDDIVFKAEFGTIIIPIAKIKDIKEIPASSIKDGVYWFPNPNTTRLYFAPTAQMLKRGEGYFADYYLFFPAFAYGITNNFTIGGGMSLIPGASMDEQMFYFTPKIGLKAAKNFNIAAGALVVKMPNFDNENDESPLVGILYGVGTVGNPDASFTLGLGYGFVDDEFANKPMVVIGGEKRISRRTAFVSENWIMPGIDNPLISYGLRFFGEKMSVDLALINILGDEFIFPGVPYIDFVINF